MGKNDYLRDRQYTIMPSTQYYRHFRNHKIYRFVAYATLEATEEEAVVYQAMYGERRLWIRTKKNFFEEVPYEGKMVPRFQPISEEEAEKELSPAPKNLLILLRGSS